MTGPSVQGTVYHSATISRIVLTNGRSAANTLRASMVLLASSLRSRVTRAAVPAFAAKETRKTAARARVLTIVVAT